jgi:hypothetical protein
MPQFSLKHLWTSLHNKRSWHNALCSRQQMQRCMQSRQASKQGAQLALPLAMFDVTLCITATCLYFMS